VQRRAPPKLKTEPSKKEKARAAAIQNAEDIAIRRELKGLGEVANAARATF